MNVTAAQETPKHRMRGARRAQLRVAATLRLSGDEQGVCLSTADLSVSGAFVESPVCVEPGEPVELSLEFANGATLVAQGVVVRCHLDAQDPRRSGMGVEFAGLGEFDRARLRRLTSGY